FENKPRKILLWATPKDFTTMTKDKMHSASPLHVHVDDTPVHVHVKKGKKKMQRPSDDTPREE
ncbi:hypothetical protein RRG08_058031, partial [Elysia crispata]